MKFFKRNQMIVTSLALLVAAAGYVSFAYDMEDIESLMASNEATVVDEQKMDADELEDALFAENEMAGEMAEADVLAGEEKSPETDSETEDVTMENPGEAVFTSAQVDMVNFAVEMKMNREQVRSANRESLMEIANSSALSETEKQAAVEKLVELTDIAEREAATEMLLEAKGFDDVVVSITDQGADVVLDMGEVTDAKRAQVEDIMKRKTGVDASEIVITPINR